MLRIIDFNVTYLCWREYIIWWHIDLWTRWLSIHTQMLSTVVMGVWLSSSLVRAKPRQAQSRFVQTKRPLVFWLDKDHCLVAWVSTFCPAQASDWLGGHNRMAACTIWANLGCFGWPIRPASIYHQAPNWWPYTVTLYCWMNAIVLAQIIEVRWCLP
jgi:hypothetical protein